MDSRGQLGIEQQYLKKTEATQRHHVHAHVTSRACFKWRHIHCWLQLVLVKPAEVFLLLRYKLSSKGTCQKNFMTIRGCLDLHMTCVRTLGALKKEEEERRRRR